VAGLDFMQLQTRFKPTVTLAFSIHDKATLGKSQLYCQHTLNTSDLWLLV